MLKKSASRKVDGPVKERGWGLMIFCARATRGRRLPSLDARSRRSLSPHPEGMTSELTLSNDGPNVSPTVRHFNPDFIFKGSLVDPQMRASNDISVICTCSFAFLWPGTRVRPDCGRRTSTFYFPTPFIGESGQGCPSLRASNEHIPIVRVLRARRAPGRSRYTPYSLEPSRVSLLSIGAAREEAHERTRKLQA
jgi:hypothetical protein